MYGCVHDREVSHWSTLGEYLVCMNVTRYHCGSGMATSVQKETTDYNRDRLKGNLSPSQMSDSRPSRPQIIY